MTTTTTPPVKVAVIGGGIAGLSCAQSLSTCSGVFQVTVFDTGRLRPGGRCSSRQAGDAAKEQDAAGAARVYPILSNYRFDHAAQLISVPEDAKFQEFNNQLLQWKEASIVKECPEGSICQIQKDGRLQPLSKTFYHGTNGMGNIPMSMIENKSFDLRQDVWVSPSSGVRYQKNSNTSWKVQANGQVLGYFDRLVIAHNGKCADRLMSKTPAKQLHSLLRVNFAPTVPVNQNNNKMTLNSMYSLTIATPANSVLSQTLRDPFVAGFFPQHADLRMITCQTRKYPPKEEHTDTHEVWTILSSPNFAKKHKAPQEFLSDETTENVSSLLLTAVAESVLGNANRVGDMSILEKRLQLWGAAVPLNVWNNANESSENGFLYDADYNVGVCGDWLLDPSIAGAWTSGRRLAEHMASRNDETAGLDGHFVRNEPVAKLGIASI